MLSKGNVSKLKYFVYLVSDHDIKQKAQATREWPFTHHNLVFWRSVNPSCTLKHKTLKTKQCDFYEYKNRANRKCLVAPIRHIHSGALRGVPRYGYRCVQHRSCRSHQICCNATSRLKPGKSTITLRRYFRAYLSGSRM